MTELLTTYSLSEIIIFCVLLAGAFKAVSSFIDWVRDKRRKVTLDEMRPDKLAEEIRKEHDEREKQIQEIERKRSEADMRLQNQIGEVANQVAEISNKVDILIDSDKDAIKSDITKEYHYFIEQKGWIDDYSMDCIERRFTHYIKENGNSFIGQLMEDLRALPRKPDKK